MLVMRVLLLVAAVLLVAPAPAGAAVPRSWLGVMADGPMTDPSLDHAGEWARLRPSGVGHVRAAFFWPHAQPTSDVLDFARSDHVVLSAARQRLGVLPVVHGTPGWAAAREGSAPPPRRAAFAGYLRALVRRYGPRGSFWAEHPEVARRPIRDWQVWNEPNLEPYWSTQPFARSFVPVMRAARRALRAEDRGARAILAGLPNRSWIALRAIYRAGGRGAFDAVALHPYTGKPGHVVKFVKLARRQMRRYGDRRKPVLITELSWPATKRRHSSTGFETSEYGQALRLRRALRLLARERRRLKIERVYWYTWLSVERGSAFGWSGLRRLRGDRVVSARSLRAFRRTARALRR